MEGGGAPGTKRRAASDNFNYIQTWLKTTAYVSSFSPSADILEASRAALVSFCPAESANYLFQDAHSESPLCFYKWGPERERERERECLVVCELSASRYGGGMSALLYC